ncbi:MAG TPA: class III extradiol dioxygenase subunit B-like domain-containing protein [Jatrophihabitans sp.]|jgi:hypothetical protein|nr:class III extradiol dioxygenase subunit B-like domain-containing protein [Jatrophihabitans sp.]
MTGVAFCPHPPLLVPEVAQGAAPELDDLRAACRVAIRRVALPDTPILVLGAGDRSRSYGPTARGTLRGYGVDIEIPLGSDDPGPVELPLSLTIGAWLLRETLGPNNGASGYSIGSGDAHPDRLERAVDCAAPVALLVMGDGSARRSTSAPGYFDERAEAFDAGVAEALRTGDAAGLRVDLGRAEELLAPGARTWKAAAHMLAGGTFDADLLYAAAPYGVGYFVAAWTRR